MQTQRIEFAVQSKDGVVQKVGKSTIYQPKISKNNSNRLYKEKPEKKNN